MRLPQAMTNIESQFPMEKLWWRDAVTYQIYIRSFADANGDGIGDIKGIISRLGYLKALGIDAIWITPWYPSPQHDNGYDVSDFMDIDPGYGTLETAQELIDEVHRSGLRIIIDIVPNHSSNEHQWFRDALVAEPGSAERNRYLFRDGKGENGEEPPNNWDSVFGGPAWTRVVEKNGEPGQWYCHIFAPEQPDFNWENPEVRDHFMQILRFWLDRNVDGFRVDVAHGLVKADGLPDAPFQEHFGLLDSRDFPYWDQDGVHEIYREWRKLLDSYPGQRMAVSEAWVNPPSRSALYVRPDELANTFNFDFLTVKWGRDSLRKSIDESFAGMSEVGAPVTWVLSNHDVVRVVNRLEADFISPDNEISREANHRARSAALLMLALPGAVFLYQGEELGLPEVSDIPIDRLQDPIWKMSGNKERGRDGCRVPLPWRVMESGAFGFSSNPELTREESWLPQPECWGDFSAEVQEESENSILQLYRNALATRKVHPSLINTYFRWVNSLNDAFVFTRSQDESFLCIVTFEDGEFIPPNYEVLIGSQKIESRRIPPNSTVWLQRTA
jgi:alpha-glucosidase